jgi:hypothetical protein
MKLAVSAGMSGMNIDGKERLASEVARVLRPVPSLESTM